MTNLLREYVRHILFEGQFEKRLQQVSSQEKFEPYREQVDQFQQALIQNGIKNVGYLNWGLKQILRSRDVEKGTIVDEIVSLLKHFDHLRKGFEKKDINQYSELGELRSAVEDRLRKKSERDRRSSKMSKVASEADQHLEKAIKESKILTGESTPEELAKSQLIVIRPTTKHASQYWGNPGSFACDISIVQGVVKWCTSATESENYFASYDQENIHLYYIIDKTKKPDDRRYKTAVAMHVSKPSLDDAEIFDAEDSTIDIEDVTESLGNKMEAVEKLIVSDIKSSTGTVGHHLLQRASTTDNIEEMRTIVEAGGKEALYKLASNPHLPEEIAIDLVEKFVDDSSLKGRSILNNLASNEALESEFLEGFADRALEKMRNNGHREGLAKTLSHLGGNTKLDTKTIEEIYSVIKEPRYRMTIGYTEFKHLADNPKTPKSVLRDLLRRQNVYDALTNPQFSFDDLVEIFTSPDDYLESSRLYAIARNPNVSPTGAIALSKSITQPRISREFLLNKLFSLRDETDIKRMYTHLKPLDWTNRKLPSMIYDFLKGNPDPPVDFLHELFDQIVEQTDRFRDMTYAVPLSLLLLVRRPELGEERLRFVLDNIDDIGDDRVREAAVATLEKM